MIGIGMEREVEGRMHHQGKCLTGLRLAAMFLLVWSIQACGNKTFPKPIRPQPLPDITAFTVQVKDAQVLLSWKLSSPLPTGKSAGAFEFLVNRATVNPETECKECPPAAAERVALIEIPTASKVRSDHLNFSWTDAATAPEATYRYQVVLTDSKQQPLGRSDTVQATLLPPPEAPGKVTALADTQGVMVQWQAPEKRKTKLPVPAQLRFAIERSTGSGGWTRVTTEPIQGTRFLDATVANGGNYIYRVSSLLDEQGVYVWGKSAESGVIVASKMMKPPPPETVWVIPDNGKLQIYWTASDGATEGYHVYRKHNGQITRLTATPVKAPPFVDDNAKANAVYAYAVSAVGLNKPHEEGLLSKWVEFRNVTFQ